MAIFFVGTEVQAKIGCLAQLLSNMCADRVGIQMGWHFISVRVFKIVALVLLVFHTPIPSRLSTFVSDAVQLTSIAAVADTECRLHLLRFLRNDVDDAPLCVRAVECRCRAVQHLDAVNAAKVFHD